MTDMVNHPPHYEKHAITLEPIDILENVPFVFANIFKYIIRAQDKGNELEDLKKAYWYLQRAIDSDTPYEGANRFWVFRFSDSPMLRDFALNLMDYHDAPEAYRLLRLALSQRISVLEKQNAS